MEPERTDLATLAVRGREVVASYLAAVDVAWADDDEDVVEILNGAGDLRRIRVSVTDHDHWALPRAELAEEPEVADGWWAFVRMRTGTEPELYLAGEDQVRELMTRLLTQSPVPAGPAEDPAADDGAAAGRITDEAIPVCTGDLRPLLRPWRELTQNF